MAERDAFARLLARHYGLDEASADRARRSAGREQPSRWLDDRSRARILDASLDVLAAVRTLTKVAEEVLRERRNRLLDEAGAPEDGSSPPDPGITRQRIPLSY